MSESNFFPYYLSDIVNDNVRWAPAKPALIFEDRVITWAGFATATARLHGGTRPQPLHRHLFRPWQTPRARRRRDDRVASRLPERIGTVAITDRRRCSRR